MAKPLLFCYAFSGDNMDIVYNKETLYVYLNETLNEDSTRDFKDKIEDIMETYDIENLVIHSNGSKTHLHEFEWDYNTRHKSKVIIK